MNLFIIKIKRGEFRLVFCQVRKGSLPTPVIGSIFKLLSDIDPSVFSLNIYHPKFV